LEYGVEAVEGVMEMPGVESDEIRDRIMSK
jgi:hypothetical protein